MKLLKIMVLLAAVCLSTIAAAEELTAEKKAALKELMNVTGASQMSQLFGNAFVQQMSDALRRARPDIDPRAFDIVREEVMAVMHEELEEKESLQTLIYPIYHKYLSLEETRALIRFYKTPLGRKSIEVMPKMTQEAMLVGQQWGRQLAPRIQQRVLARFAKEGITKAGQ
ncbi:MAG: DUF2059 domain-containing protein [Gammaproteobacteria bacterium]